jgi:hypothetical protein
MARGVPTANETIAALRSHFARGAVGPMQASTNIGAGANIRPGRPASGGATAGLDGNPARGGNPPLHGTGSGLVPNTTPWPAFACRCERPQFRYWPCHSSHEDRPHNEGSGSGSYRPSDWAPRSPQRGASRRWPHLCPKRLRILGHWAVMPTRRPDAKYVAQLWRRLRHRSSNCR